MSAPEELVVKLIVCLQNQADMIDLYVDKYPSWESKRKETISSLESIAADLKKSVQVANQWKVGGASAAITGGTGMVLGAILLPFTFGASSALIAGGAAAAIGGGVTMGVADLTKYGITKSRCDSIDEMVKADSVSTDRITAILTIIRRSSEEINGLLNKLCSGPKIEQMQVLRGVAVACGNTWIGRSLSAIYYSAATKMLPVGYYTEPLTLEARANYTVTVMESQLVMPPTSCITLTFQSEGIETESEAAEAEVVETEEAELLAELEALEIEEELELESAASLEEEIEALETEIEEAEEAEILELEALETEEISEIELMGALELGTAVAEMLLPAAFIVGFGVYGLVSAIKEIENGSKVANTIADVANKLSTYTDVAETVYTKLKRYKQSKQQREKKMKKVHYLLSVVSVSTFNIKGTVQNDEYKDFLMNAFSKLKSNLCHIQECIWSERGAWVKKHILPDYKIRISQSGDAGIASHTVFLKEQGPPSCVVNPFPNRVYCLKFSTNINFEVIKHEMGLPEVIKSNKTLEFLSFSYHGYHKVPSASKIIHIKKFMENAVEQKNCPQSLEETSTITSGR